MLRKKVTAAVAVPRCLGSVAFWTAKVMTCRRSDTVAYLMEQMTEGKFRHLPVVEDGQVVGLISIGDVVKHRVMEYESEQEALRDYIKTA